MNTLKPHKHHDVIVAWAAGHPIQCKHRDESIWKDVIGTPAWMTALDYRVKPKEVEMEKVVFEIELPKSYKGVIPQDADYFTVHESQGFYSVRSCTNYNPPVAEEHQKNFKVFLDEKAAELFCKILNDLEFLKGLTKP